MTTNQNIEIVQAGYAAYGRGDLAAVTGYFSDDAEWIVPGTSDMPLAGTYRGHAGIEKFFSMLSQTVEVLDFQIHEFLPAGDKVVVLGRERGRMLSSGRTIEFDWVHIYSFRDGKIVRFQDFYDTATVHEAYLATGAA